MPSHDVHFKQLLRTFFREFLQAFVPELARDLKRGSVEFLDKELVRASPGRYRSRIVDLVARVRLHEEPGFVLVHVEHQVQRHAQVRERLYYYATWLMEQYSLPVYPILLTSYDRPCTPEPDRYIVEVRGLRVVEFRFRVVQLNRLNWRRFLRLQNPVAAALMAKMQIAPQDRARVRFQILRLLAQLRLDRRKMDLIAGFVSTYLSLRAKEYLSFQREVDNIEDRQLKVRVMELMTEWQRKGRQEGREEGRREGQRGVIEQLLAARFGPVTQGVRRRLKRLSAGQLEALARVLLDFNSLADLERWLTEHSS